MYPVTELVAPSAWLDGEDLVGTWKGEGGARLVLKADGSYSATDLFACAGMTGGSSGTWKLTDDMAFGWFRIIEIDQVEGELWVESADEIRHLVGDPDSNEWCGYTKVKD